MQLTADEQRILEQIYGRQFNTTTTVYAPNLVEKVKELNEYEEKFFDHPDFMSPHYFVQMLYKVKGNVTPASFTRAVRNLLKETEDLRANYCSVGRRTVKIIFSERAANPEINFNKIKIEPDEINDFFRKVTDADMRRDFDLKHDWLVRFSVFSYSEEEFAVLVTMPQYLSWCFDAKNFFASFTGTESFQPVNGMKYPQVNRSIEQNVRDYWSKVLKNFPPSVKLPYSKPYNGSFTQKVYRTEIPADIISELRGKSQSNNMMLSAILQAAWGFFLQSDNVSGDVAFGRLIQVRNPTGGSPVLNMIPIRVNLADGQTVEDIVKAQFKQLIISRSYGSFDWRNLSDDLEHDKKILNHFLTFRDAEENSLDFFGTKVTAESAEVFKNSWDAHGMKLGLYFDFSPRSMAVTFNYDKNSFTADFGDILSNIFTLVLQQMILNWNSPIKKFNEDVENRIEAFMNEDKIARAELQKRIRDFILTLPLLQGEDAGTVDLFASYSEIHTHFEGDRISGEIFDKNFVFVVEGKVARNVDTGDGLYNTLDIMKHNGWINDTVLLPKRRTKISAEVLTERAVLLTIPLEKVKSALVNHSQIAMNVALHALQQMEKYQKLWIMA